jgi:hypothetical protein
MDDYRRAAILKLLAQMCTLALICKANGDSCKCASAAMRESNAEMDDEVRNERS